MKKIKNKITALTLVCCVLSALMMGSGMSAFAAEYDIDENTIKSNITAIEEELSENGTDVTSELNDMIADYTALMSDASEEDIIQLTSLITTLKEVRDEYALYEAGISTYKFHAIYTPAVAAVIAYFNSNGYSLAAELLTHAKDNTKLNSNYYPSNGQRVKQSPTFTSIANGKKTSGSAAFENTGNTVQKDLFYAIHNFNWTKSSASSKTVTIRDRYDYAPGDYSGIAGIAVDTMYKAQQAGVIVPYYVIITATA